MFSKLDKKCWSEAFRLPFGFFVLDLCSCEFLGLWHIPSSQLSVLWEACLSPFIGMILLYFFFFSRSSGGIWILLRRNSTGISCWRPMGKWSQEVRAWASLIGGDEKTGKVLDVSCTFQQTCLGCVGEGIHGAAVESWGVRGQACKYRCPNNESVQSDQVLSGTVWVCYIQ